MFAHKKNYWCAGYVVNPLPNICVHGYLNACLHCMALLCIQLDHVMVSGPLFVCLVCGLLEKKK